MRQINIQFRSTSCTVISTPHQPIHALTEKADANKCQQMSPPTNSIQQTCANLQITIITTILTSGNVISLIFWSIAGKQGAKLF